MAAKELSNFICQKVLNFGEVKAKNFGRPVNIVAMHPYVEFLIT